MRNRVKDYYYKNSCLTPLDEIEYMLFEQNNDYGYNLGSERRQIIHYEKILENPKYYFNKKYFNEKK